MNVERVLGVSGSMIRRNVNRGKTCARGCGG